MLLEYAELDKELLFSWGSTKGLRSRLFVCMHRGSLKICFLDFFVAIIHCNWSKSDTVTSAFLGGSFRNALSNCADNFER